MPKFSSNASLPKTIPVFPLDGAMLLPRGTLPLSIFEPRYIAMIDHALATDRLVGMVQTTQSYGSSKGHHAIKVGDPPLCGVGCAGRISLFSETEDDRYMIQLTGLCRFSVEKERDLGTPFRQVDAIWDAYQADLHPEDNPLIDRSLLLKTLSDYLQANNLETDWDSIKEAENESLVNALCMMCPYGVKEKQALLEAKTLSERADILIAVTEMSLSQSASDGSTQLQ